MKRLSLALALLFFASVAHAVVPATRPGNAAYTITNTDVMVITSTAFTAPRTWTLPSAAGTCIGQVCKPPANQLMIVDVAGTVTGTNTLTIAPPSGNTINGNAANLILSAAGVKVILWPTSSTNWAAYVEGDRRVATVAVGSAVALTTTTAANITTISLSQGVWDCFGNTARALNASTSVTEVTTSITATTATPGALGVDMVAFTTAANVLGGSMTQNIGPIRLSPAATTTYYLVADDTFTVSTNAAYGSIICNRVR